MSTKQKALPSLPDTVDLDTLRASESARIQLTHPVQKTPLPMWVTIAHPNSAAARTARALANKDVKSEEDSSGVELMAKVTLGWEGFISGGSPIAFSTENVRSIYAATSTSWVANQVAAAYLDIGSFFPPVSSS